MSEQIIVDEAKSRPVNNSPQVYLKTALGLVFVICGMWLVLAWWDAVWVFVRGCAGIILCLIGAVVLALAKE